MNNFWHNLPKPFFALAPMEQVTDVVFRHVIKKAGAPDLFYTEFANATGWVHAGNKGIGGRLVKTNDEKPIVAQIWGGEPGDMEQFARHCASLGFDGIDINMGCPAKSAVKSGGSALIRQPDLAAAAIAAAKKAGLPVSVKTRLGYTYIDEWRDWLTHLLQQDIVALTIHLRTKKEMSKVPAHWELIPQIKKLRDEIAPHTLLVINGDIKNRQQGMELVDMYGVDGIMIGRGVFTDPFCFAQKSPLPSLPALPARRSLAAGPADWSAPPFEKSTELIYSKAGAAPPVVTRLTAAANDTSKPKRATFPLQDSNHPEVEPIDPSDETLGSDTVSVARERYLEAEKTQSANSKQKLIALLHYHLDLYDRYANQTKRPYETLKRFYKIYIRDFDGASETRDKLMHTKTTDEARQIINHLS